MFPSKPAFAERPASGRTFLTSRTVRSTDVSPGGRLRFDAVARYLQEAAEDDITDAGWAPPYGWLLRRCEITVRDYPSRGEAVELCTFCSALGPRWAERTTTVAGPAGDLMQARAVWVAIDRSSGEPVPLGSDFARVYGESAQGRHVSARLSLPAPGEAAAGRDWPLRASDFDTAGHVNNTIHWAAVEEVLTAWGELAPPDQPAPDQPPQAGRPFEAGAVGWLPTVAELEYHRPILPGLLPRLLTSGEPGNVMVWLMNGTEPGDAGQAGTQANGAQASATQVSAAQVSGGARLASARLTAAP